MMKGKLLWLVLTAFSLTGLSNLEAKQFIKNNILYIVQDVKGDDDKIIIDIKLPTPNKANFIKSLNLKINHIDTVKWKHVRTVKDPNWKGNNPYFTQNTSPVNGRYGLFKVIFAPVGNGVGPGKEKVVDVILEDDGKKRYYILPQKNLTLCVGSDLTLTSWIDDRGGKAVSSKWTVYQNGIRKNSISDSKKIKIITTGTPKKNEIFLSEGTYEIEGIRKVFNPSSNDKDSISITVEKQKLVDVYQGSKSVIPSKKIHLPEQKDTVTLKAIPNCGELTDENTVWHINGSFYHAEGGVFHTTKWIENGESIEIDVDTPAEYNIEVSLKNSNKLRFKYVVYHIKDFSLECGVYNDKTDGKPTEIVNPGDFIIKTVPDGYEEDFQIFYEGPKSEVVTQNGKFIIQPHNSAAAAFKLFRLESIEDKRDVAITEFTIVNPEKYQSDGFITLTFPKLIQEALNKLTALVQLNAFSLDAEKAISYIACECEVEETKKIEIAADINFDLKLPATGLKNIAVKKLKDIVGGYKISNAILSPVLNAVDKITFEMGVNFESTGKLTGYKNRNCDDEYEFPSESDNKAQIKGTAFVTAGYTKALIDDLLKKLINRKKELEAKKKGLDKSKKEKISDIKRLNKDSQNIKKRIDQEKVEFEKKKAKRIAELKKKRNRITGSGANEKKKKISAQIESISKQKTNNTVKKLQEDQERIKTSIDRATETLQQLTDKIKVVGDLITDITKKIEEIRKKANDAAKDADNRVDIAFGGERSYSLNLKGADTHIDYKHSIESLKVTGQITVIFRGEKVLPRTVAGTTYGKLEFDLDDGFDIDNGKWTPEF